VRQSDNYELITFTSRSKLHGQWGPKQRRVVHRGRLGLPWPSHLFQSVPDAEVDELGMVLGVGAMRRWLYLATKPSHLGVDHLGTYGPILSYQTFKVAASREPNSGGAYLILEALRHDRWEPGRVPSWVTRMGHNQRPLIA
jgi:hypothetical protein